MSQTTENNEIPKEMKRLVVTSPGEGKSVADCTIVTEIVPTPVPASGEVLVKVFASPINPSDYGSWHRSKPESYPMLIGKEGSGIVVASGGGLTTRRCPIGSPVGFIMDGGKQGSYSEYVSLNATTHVFLMPTDTPIEDCASFFVNPYTAVGIIDTARKEGSNKAIVHTAAASQLGQMLNKLALTEEIEIINVVRREEQADLLREIGAKHIVVTGSSGDDESEAKWKNELKDKINDLGATCAFDAVAGRMTGALMDCMPQKGTVYVYGGLSGPVENISPMDLIYRKKQLKGFLLTTWIFSGGPLLTLPRLISAGRKVNSGLTAPGWSSTQFSDTSIEDAHDNIVQLLGSSITGKKLRIRFN